MKQQFDFVEVNTEFAYTGSVYDSLAELQQNILEYEMYFQSMDWTKDELENISHQLVETGRIFAENQGFSPNSNFIEANWTSGELKKMGDEHGLFHPNQYSKGRGPTGRLYHGIKSEIQGNKIRFYNDARNDRGQPYAGHMEYGFRDRGNNLIPARPFMRPALYAVAEGSKGNFRSIMKGLLENMWTSRGFRGISTLQFGHKRGSQAIFWRNPSQFGGKIGSMSRIRELRGSSHRKGLTSSHHSKLQKKAGFSLSKNRRDMVPKWLRDLRKFENETKTGQRKVRSGQAERHRTKQRKQKHEVEAYNKKVQHVNFSRGKEVVEKKTVPKDTGNKESSLTDYEMEELNYIRGGSSGYGSGHSYDYVDDDMRDW